jgi:hypothetical protein
MVCAKLSVPRIEDDVDMVPLAVIIEEPPHLAWPTAIPLACPGAHLHAARHVCGGASLAIADAGSATVSSASATGTPRPACPTMPEVHPKAYGARNRHEVSMNRVAIGPSHPHDVYTPPGTAPVRSRIREGVSTLVPQQQCSRSTTTPSTCVCVLIGASTPLWRLARRLPSPLCP